MAPGDRLPDLPVKIDGPRPIGSLADLSDLLGGDSHRSRRFLGGLIAGALVGAAIAGGTLLRRRQGGGPS
jgi:hypothetical protein